MRFGAKILVTRGSAGRPRGGPGALREVPAILIGARGYERRARLLEDDPLDTVGWHRAGDVGWWCASAVRRHPAD